MSILILILVILVIGLLGRYAIQEGVRIEQQKKFKKDLDNWDKKNKK